MRKQIPLKNRQEYLQNDVVNLGVRKLCGLFIFYERGKVNTIVQFTRLRAL